MITPQQVLFDSNVARFRAEQEERKWIKLRRECQAPAILGITWIGGFLVICLIALLKNHPDDWNELAALFAPLLLMAPGVIMVYQRKQKTLMKIIDAEAPALAEKLKIKGIT